MKKVLPLLCCLFCCLTACAQVPDIYWGEYKTDSVLYSSPLYCPITSGENIWYDIEKDSFTTYLRIDGEVTSHTKERITFQKESVDEALFTQNGTEINKLLEQCNSKVCYRLFSDGDEIGQCLYILDDTLLLSSYSTSRQEESIIHLVVLCAPLAELI